MVSLPFLHLHPGGMPSLTRQNRQLCFSPGHFLLIPWVEPSCRVAREEGEGPAMGLVVGAQVASLLNLLPASVSVAVFAEEAARPLNQQLLDPETCSSLLWAPVGGCEEPPLAASILAPRAFGGSAERDPGTRL